MTLPSVTGRRFRPRKALHVSAWLEGAGTPTVAAKSGSKRVIRRPRGTKYMLATECSKPAATKALIGGTMARTRSAVVRAESVSQTARQTSVLQSTPSATACAKPSSTLACAMARAVTPKAPPPARCAPPR